MLVAHCRAGFEPEAAADLLRLAEAAGTALDLDAPTGRGFVVGRPARFDPSRWAKTLAGAAPIFIRSLFVGSGPHVLFDPARAKGRPDRVMPLIALIDALRADPPLRLAGVGTVFGTAPRDRGHQRRQGAFGALSCADARHSAQALTASGALTENRDAPASTSRPRLHVLFADGAHVFVGISAPPWGSPWPMGIPRMRMPREAPSRSTQKLAEAFVTFLGERTPEMLRAGMKAVDLGAAPGGWSWQLAHRGLRVTAIDNGPLKGEVAQDSLVTHLRVDGLALPAAASGGLDGLRHRRTAGARSPRWSGAGSPRATRGGRSSISSCR